MNLRTLSAVGLLSLNVLLLAGCDAGAADRAQAETYIRSHVSELSPEPAVLGGTFTVTEIRWIDETTAIVSYEDGHIALEGRTSLVKNGDEVTVSAFTVLESGSGSTVSQRPLSKEGEFCGGIAGFQCDFGLMCRLDGAYPDAGGTCVR